MLSSPPRPWGLPGPQARRGQRQKHPREGGGHSPSHLLEEPDVEDGEGCVQQVVQRQEPAFVQGLRREGW